MILNLSRRRSTMRSTCMCRRVSVSGKGVGERNALLPVPRYTAQTRDSSPRPSRRASRSRRPDPRRACACARPPSRLSSVSRQARCALLSSHRTSLLKVTGKVLPDPPLSILSSASNPFSVHSVSDKPNLRRVQRILLLAVSTAACSAESTATGIASCTATAGSVECNAVTRRNRTPAEHFAAC